MQQQLIAGGEIKI